ncbi:MSMEG_1061 family FMN-dependent PPOX-type flavoprotein [Rhodococcoides trifolii]|nr:MSMEG_1061 family FMN-dependent PPOX-type flavoprotein [Rhodococcus trifolii]
MTVPPSIDVDRLVATSLTSAAELEAVLGVPHPNILDKHRTFTTPLVRTFVSMARFFVLATSDADGNCDSSPRGDIESTVLFPDDRTVVIPDRPGNRRADSYRNILDNPHVGIMFLVPGVDEVVRINGRATLTVDPDMLQQMSIGSRPAQLGLVVRVDEVYVHCARAVLRSKVFEPQTWPDTDGVPTLREMSDELHGITEVSTEPKRSEDYRTALY